MNQAKPRLLLLILAAAAFIGWLSYLSYVALMKNRGPVVSRVQAAAAAHAVIGEVAADADGKPTAEVKIIESMTAGAPAAGAEIYVVNVYDAQGFQGPGPYLLLLAGAKNQMIPLNGKQVPMFAIVGSQRSPGYELADSGHPTIYKMTDAIRAQAKKLFP